MGNQLAGIAPSQIFPVERYLTDHPELKFDTSLGSTRFFKVARAESQEGLIVVKVFVIHDPSLPLIAYKDRLDVIRKKLSAAVNCIPFQKILLTERAGIVMREYVKHSLYDRISTRPFLTHIEKRWITFQILYALYQCHKVGVCHGDIKLENITVTSWNWVLLVDFASFKPTFLPEDNPADYSYFFDTSRRRTCYIAPERFAKATSTENSAVISETSCDVGDLTPAMDIFSAGCALLELWNELHVPFEYSQLLAYRAGKYSPQQHLAKLDDLALRNLIASMISLDPSKRLSAENYLAQERGNLFPEYFFTFLQSYMLIFSSNPILSPDEKILRLKNDIGNIFKFLGPVTATQASDGDGKIDNSDDEKGDMEKYLHQKRGESEGLVLITSLVTSCIRGLLDCISKLYSLEILLELATHASDETLLDRILPYIMYLAHDNTSRVKICAINTITKCLNLVEQVPRSDSNIFPEYILPGLAHLAIDQDTCVRVAYAKNIATLAEIALRYLDQIQNNWHDTTNTNTGLIKQKDTFNYESELQVLHEMVEQTVSMLLTDAQSLVKQTLMENGITKLCVFFGKQKANDVILSHMITFLNDKEDKQLRGSFFDCIVGVAAYIGWHSSGILTPLLLQGLTDCSEFVTAKSINAMTSLAELGLLPKSALCEVVAECACFLVHPNLWIRQAVAGFITSVARWLSILDVQCKIVPNLTMYMKYSLIQMDRCELLLDTLVSPIPRNVYDSVIGYSEIDLVLQMLEERKNFRECVITGTVPSIDYANKQEMHSSLKNLFRRLEANGMTDTVGDYLLQMQHHLRKIHKHKTSADARHNKQTEGRIEISSSAQSSIKGHVFNLADSHKGVDFNADRRLHRTNTSGSIDTNVNSDWNYSSEMLTRQSDGGGTNSGGPSSRSTSSRPSSPPNDSHTPLISNEPSSNVSLHERSYIQYRTSSCYRELNKLKIKQQEHYYEARKNKEWAEQVVWQPQLPPPEWRLRGVLVAHLHEHRYAVNRLCTIPKEPFFASCSADGYVRLWDCSKMEGKNIANRSKQYYKMPNGDNVTGMAVCEGGQSIGAIAQDGSINLLRIAPTGNKMTLMQTKQLDLKEDGYAVDIKNFDAGSQNVLVYATLYGSIIGWDLRTPGIAWRFENGLKQGFITSFCLDSHQSWLTAGTSNGILKVWDLRFHLPINTIGYSGSGRIIKVISHPLQHSWVISSIPTNNQISMWNLETRNREKVLWGSTAPLLSNDRSSIASSVCAMYAGTIDSAPFLLAGGSDQRLRFWNLSSPRESYLAVPAAKDNPGTMLNYLDRLVDGTSVIYEEMRSFGTKEKTEDGRRAGPEQPPVGHRDCISDITLCKAAQCFAVTASKDGIIKVWK